MGLTVVGKVRSELKERNGVLRRQNEPNRREGRGRRRARAILLTAVRFALRRMEALNLREAIMKATSNLI